MCKQNISTTEITYPIATTGPYIAHGRPLDTLSTTAMNFTITFFIHIVPLIKIPFRKAITSGIPEPFAGGWTYWNINDHRIMFINILRKYTNCCEILKHNRKLKITFYRLR